MRAHIGLSMAVSAMLAASPALAQPSPDLAGKSVSLIIGFGPGGGYDLWGRVVARHIARHLPGNPTIVPQNMPGAGSFVAANNIYNIARKDGTVFAIIARDAALGPLSGADGTKFDPLKFTWLGTPTKETNVCIAYKSAKVQSFDALLKTELVVGDTGPGTGTRTYPLVLNAIMGTKFKIVGGFPSSQDVFLAMERGEVEGICESLDSVTGKRPDWLRSKTVTVLFQAGAEPNPALPGVPFALDLAKTEEQKQAMTYLYAGQGIGRPFVAPPNMVPERARMLQTAFWATMKDPEFVADARKNNLDVDPEDGAHLLSLMQRIYATPKAVIDKVGALVK